MEKITVMVFEGKHGCADTVFFRNFESMELAKDFIASITDLKSKYWTIAKIVKEDVQIEIPFNY